MDTSVVSQNILNRDKRLAERKPITVLLSETQIDEEPYRCHKCGRPVTTIQNEVDAIIHGKVLLDQLHSKKIIGGLCIGCNIRYYFN